MRGRLLDTKRTTEHKQARLKIPTNLGIEFLELMKNIEGYRDACIKCHDKIKQLLVMLQSGDEKSKKSKLKYSGWINDGITPGVIQYAYRAKSDLTI